MQSIRLVAQLGGRALPDLKHRWIKEGCHCGQLHNVQKNGRWRGSISVMECLLSLSIHG